jgi:hypothetical protein
MAATDWLEWGCPLAQGSTAGFTNFTLNESTDALEVCFQTSEAMTITALGFRYGVRTGTPPTFKASLQGVNTTTGFPDGTIKGGGSPASVTFTPPADATWNSTWQWVTLDNSYAAARGEMLYLVITYDSGTIDGSNNSSFTSDTDLIQRGAGPGSGAATTNNAGVRSASTNAAVFGYKSSSKVYGNPVLARYTGTYNSATTPDEYAMRFMLPSGASSTYQVVGCRVKVSTVTLGQTLKFRLYSETTVLGEWTVDTDYLRGSPAAGTGPKTLFFNDVTLPTLDFGTAYRIAFQPVENSSGQIYEGFTVNAQADLDAYPGGQEWYLSTRTNEGAWSDTVTARPQIELIVAAMTASGGGGSIFSGLVVR